MNKCKEIELKSYKLTSLPLKPIPNAILYIKGDADLSVSVYVTDLNGIPYPLKDNEGSSGIQSVYNDDGTISVIGNSDVKISLASYLSNLINLSIQPGDLISSLVNDLGYITLSDIPSQVVNLQSIPSSTNVVISNTNGTSATILPATTTDSGVLLPAEKIKLNNLSNVNTGDQITIVGISGTKAEYNTSLSNGDFLFVGDITAYTNEEAQDAIGTILLDTSTIDLTYDDSTPSISATVKPNSITSTELADTINLTEFVNNAGFETTSQLNARDTTNRNRSNHTGTQAISTVVNLQSSLDSKVTLLKQIKIVSSTTYTILSTDIDKILHFTSNTEVNLTVPTGLPSNGRYEGKQLGDGQVTFVQDGTLLHKGLTNNLKTAQKYSPFAIDWESSDIYVVYGELELA